MSDEHEDEEGNRERVLSNGQVMAFIAGFWLRRRGLLAGTLGFTLAAVALDVAMPWAAKGLVDAVAAPAHAAPAAWKAWGVLLAVYLGFTITRNTGFRFWNPLAARNMREMTDEGFARVQSFSADWHADNFGGSTVRKLSRGMWGYDSASDAVILWLTPALLVLTGLSFSMMIQSFWVGLMSLGVVGAFLWLNLWAVKIYVRPANLRSNALDSRIGGALADSITSNPTVKSFGAEPREAARMAQVTGAWSAAVQITWGRFMDIWVLQNALMVLLLAGLTGFLVRDWTLGRATPGGVAFAITSFMQMSGYLRNLGENVRMLQKGMDDVEDVAGFARMAAQVPDAAGASEFRPGDGQIVFDRVTFRYKSAAEPLYEAFSLAIAPGERVALVGPTGAGKSTFVKLIQRLYELDAGRILVDGQDIASVTQQSLRRAIAVVPQDPALFHRTVAENISYGRPDATHDEIVAAAKRARAHGFISGLPKGYDTLVGERGVKLSGGERQRVAIARAFLADAPILVLDEATSSLDVETERLVQAASDALMAGRTTIVIAHRLSTIRHADRILVFEDGRVVEEGSHAELAAKGGVYARLNAVAEGAA
ncbi:MAG: multidrug transporter ATP-binding protein [Caulobacter sp.]|nr:multidrug transporter ATP-binding protein [Caulobacter sp.]